MVVGQGIAETRESDQWQVIIRCFNEIIMTISILLFLAMLISACTEVQEIKDIHVSEINILSEGDVVLPKGGTASVEF